jgi:L-asparaginase
VTRVLLLATGDTIAYTQRAGRPHIATGAELVATVPPEALAADVTAVDVAAEPSWDMPPGTMLDLARRARDAILAEGYDGVVITHGTETLEDTAYLCDLLAGPAPLRDGDPLSGLAGEMGAIGARGLSAAKARIALMVALGGGGVAAVRAWFARL